MFKSWNLAETALITNGMVWFGLALFFAGLVGEETWAAFHGQWFNIVGWVIIIAAAIGTAVIGVLEVRRLRARLKSHQNRGWAMQKHSPASQKLGSGDSPCRARHVPLTVEEGRSSVRI